MYIVDEKGNRIVLDKMANMTVSIQLDANKFGNCKLYILHMSIS